MELKQVGILALQGAFREHKDKLEQLGAEAVLVRTVEQLSGVERLIIPGGESTVIGKLAMRDGLLEPLREFARSRPVWGTCAGMIFMAREVGREQPLLGVLDIEVERNAFGRQLDSFETELSSQEPGLDEGKYSAVFIRAPLVKAWGEGVQVLSRLADGRVVAVRQGQLLATAFHPELTDDSRWHRYFLGMATS